MARRGRPRMASGTQKASTFSVRFSPGERTEIRQAAQLAGAASDSLWARGVLIDAARAAVTKATLDVGV